MKTIINKCIWLVLVALIAVSCAKTLNYTDIPEQQAFFSYKADSYVVTFTNESKMKGTYNWNFGDGSTSSEENPVHDFGKKGKYPVTLTVTSGSSVYEAYTSLQLDKTSPIKLDDGTLADWEQITKNVVISGADGKVVKKGKFDYDAKYIYVYIEQATTIVDGSIMDMYIDTDAKSTGYDLSGYFPGVGVEWLIEGSIIPSPGWCSAFNYTGSGSDWSWGDLGISEFYKVGHYEESGGLLKYEFAISRAKISGLSDSKGVKIGIVMSDSGWSEIGYMPDKGTQDGYFLNLDQ